MSYIRLLLSPILFAALVSNAQLPVSPVTNGNYDLAGAGIIVDSMDHEVVKKAAFFLASDLQSVTNKPSQVQFQQVTSPEVVIVIGSLDRSVLLKKIIRQYRIPTDDIRGKWEAYKILTVQKANRTQLLVIGSDRRGAAYGAMEISRRMGVSPWKWWADVPVRQQTQVVIARDSILTDAPKVKYRGIFINDEAPALSNWSKEKFGGFNAAFYTQVFELMLRLRSNYIWPAMWGNAFYDDDSLNIKIADDFAIVIGTSHHEPLMRAHDEWRRYGNQQPWNYDSSKAGLQAFWTTGMKRAWNEKIVSVGMRGDGDEPMSRETATALLERIVKDQRTIISKTTGKPAAQTPQLWALYKEVQDYYRKGMRVPDDVTLLLCDDNWGNLRMLPKPDEPARKGGYGIYYHFDYVGGPRNYKWINTNPLPRIWEQMNLAWQHDVKQIWIVNVGDIKPMEFPISFFLDYAWNPDRIGADDLFDYTRQWAAQQFGDAHAYEIAQLLAGYGKLNSRRKPELLDQNTYSFHYNEWQRVVDEYTALKEKAEQIQLALASEFQDAYFQLILHPVLASSNLYQLYHQVALNHKAFAEKLLATNYHAEKARKFYEQDSLITLAYHQIKKGKWNHMMSQTHIGYTYWQQPPVNKMPAVKTFPPGTVYEEEKDTLIQIRKAPYPKNINYPAFFEYNGIVSIDAANFSRKQEEQGIQWKALPDHGRTGNAISSYPATAKASTVNPHSSYLEYEFYSYSKDTITLHTYFSPSLNFYGTENGLEYAVSIDEEQPQLISLNKEDKTSISGIWNKWVAENCIVKTSRHFLSQPGKHRIRIWRVSNGVVVQKLVLDLGGLKPSYLGPPETRIHSSPTPIAK